MILIMRWFKIILFLPVLAFANDTLSVQNPIESNFGETIKEDTALTLQDDNPAF